MKKFFKIVLGFVGLIIVMYYVELNNETKSKDEVGKNSVLKKEEKVKKKKVEKVKKKKVVKKEEDFWNKFDPMVKERVNELIYWRDCKGLQNEFNITMDNWERNRKRFGGGKHNHHFSDLTEYIDKNMRKIGCYN